MNNDYYTLDEVSKKIKVPVAYLRRMIKEHKLKAHLMGRSYKVTEIDLNSYINSCGVKNER